MAKKKNPRASRTRRRKQNRAVLSGPDWVLQFPTSRDPNDLASPFRENCKRFLDAMLNAGALIEINATYRPRERAYLMHYAYRIAKGEISPTDVPKMEGVDIDWVHRKPNGSVDRAASKQAAEEMVEAYGIAFRPALVSQHTARLAIDMSISWEGTLTIKDADGDDIKISSNPKSGQNSALHRVGASYGVIKLVADPPHWSVDGGLLPDDGC
ncbi:MAG: hypothetical protein K2X77_32660 [Candidatus Obscuribacterales bacterium]|jgi:hypothetical protein|nr:hypothetical protein [Candidatus Obscuribacterales bacterium]